MVVPSPEGDGSVCLLVNLCQPRCVLGRDYALSSIAFVSMVAAYQTIRPKAVLFTTSAMLYTMFNIFWPSASASIPVSYTHLTLPTMS